MQPLRTRHQGWAPVSAPAPVADEDIGDQLAATFNGGKH